MSTVVVDARLAPPRMKAHERALLRVLPSFTDLAFLFPMAALFLLLQGVRTILGDSDTGWQIRTGDWILQHGRVPQVDMFSFSKPGQPWFAWEWLWDVLFALIHRQWGLSGVVLANVLILGTLSVLFYRLVRRHAGNDALALGITLAGLCATAIHWLARPHLVSWVLILVALHLIDRAQQGRTRLLWWFPALTALWANLHGSFPIAIFFLLAYGVGNAVQDVAQGVRLGAAIRGQRTYFLCAAVSLLASLLNPYGWHLHEHIFRYLGDAAQLNRISEYASFDFHSPLAPVMETFLLLGGCAALYSLRRGSWAQSIVLLVWAHLAFKSARNVPIFVFLAAGPVAELVTAGVAGIRESELANWLKNLSAGVLEFGKGFDAMERVERVPFIPVAAAVILAMLLGVAPKEPRKISDFNKRDFPVAAAGVIAEHPGARVFTFDQWGGYLIYRLYPKVPVFVDGRSDYYGAKFGDHWVDALKAGYDWEKELTSFSINTVLLRPKDPLATVLKQRPDWRVAFDDGGAIVFEKR